VIPARTDATVHRSDSESVAAAPDTEAVSTIGRKDPRPDVLYQDVVGVVIVTFGAALHVAATAIVVTTSEQPSETVRLQRVVPTRVGCTVICMSVEEVWIVAPPRPSSPATAVA